MIILKNFVPVFDHIMSMQKDTFRTVFGLVIVYIKLFVVIPFSYFHPKGIKWNFKLSSGIHTEGDHGTLMREYTCVTSHVPRTVEPWMPVGGEINPNFFSFFSSVLFHCFILCSFGNLHLSRKWRSVIVEKDFTDSRAIMLLKEMKVGSFAKFRRSWRSESDIWASQRWRVFQFSYPKPRSDGPSGTWDSDQQSL